MSKYIVTKVFGGYDIKCIGEGRLRPWAAFTFTLWGAKRLIKYRIEFLDKYRPPKVVYTYPEEKE